MNPWIALDADGVLLDYHQAYADAWGRAFGERPALRDPQAYWPIDRWNVQRVSGAQLERLRACFDDAFWGSIPALPGALDWRRWAFRWRGWWPRAAPPSKEAPRHRPWPG